MVYNNYDQTFKLIATDILNDIKYLSNDNKNILHFIINSNKKITYINLFFNDVSGKLICSLCIKMVNGTNYKLLETAGQFYSQYKIVANVLIFLHDYNKDIKSFEDINELIIYAKLLENKYNSNSIYELEPITNG